MTKIWLAIVVGLPLTAQPILRLKSGEIRGLGPQSTAAEDFRARPERAHLLVQFERMPGPEDRRALEERGARVLEFVPDNGYIVVASSTIDLSGLPLTYWGELTIENKVSPYLANLPPDMPVVYLAEFHRDVAMDIARTLVWAVGGEVLENPDLVSNELMVRTTPEELRSLAAFDGVSYLFPAAEELQQRSAVLACQSGMVSGMVGSNLASFFGDGWDGPGANAVNLSYYYESLPSVLPAEQVKAEIERAMAAWSQVAVINFQNSSMVRSLKGIDIQFARGEHGDGNGFDGPGRVLAHTYYPPPNPETIAGDMHFDLDENWQINKDVDVFSVALHELGHALGLGHSDDPNSVMYPYYRRYSQVNAEDVSAIQQLYATRTQNPGQPEGPTPPDTPTEPEKPNVSPYAVTIQSPTSAGSYQTGASAVGLGGSVAPATGLLRVEWRNARGGSGVARGTAAWTATGIPLQAGSNMIEVTATPRSGSAATTQIEVTRTASTARDTTAPSLTIVSPAQVLLTTSASSIVLRGRAVDNTGVTGVSWTNSLGGSGNATGTTSWTTTAIPLRIGSNTLVVRASDAANNQSWRSVSVTRR